MNRKSLLPWALAVAGALCLLSENSEAANVALYWNASPDANVAGYRLCWGQSSGDYTATISAGLKTSFSLTDLVPGLTYYLSLTAYDRSGVDSEFANEVRYTVPYPPIPTRPSFLKLPTAVTFTQNGVTITPGASVTVAPHANVTFSTAVTGTSPLKFQWFLGKTLLAGPATNTLSLSNVASSNAGVYTLTVSNSLGCVTSAPMTLVIVPLLSRAYNGLFYQTNADGSADIETDSSGFLGNCILNASGAYSGRLYLDNTAYVITGTIDPYGHSQTVVSRSANSLSNLNVQLRLDSALGVGQLTGTVSNTDDTDPWVASLTADSAANPLLVSSLQANLLSTDPDSPDPGLIGFTSLLGQTTVLGQLSDGALFLETIPVSTTSRLPVYASLYGGQGLLEGWISLANGNPTGWLTWIQEPDTDTNSPDGFTRLLIATTNSP